MPWTVWARLLSQIFRKSAMKRILPNKKHPGNLYEARGAVIVLSDSLIPLEKG